MFGRQDQLDREGFQRGRAGAHARAGPVIPWHYYTVITDTTYCLEGTVKVELLGPPERVLLAVGQSCAITTNRPHQITGHGDVPCRLLLVQGLGEYDRHPVDPKTWQPSASVDAS